MYGLPHAKADGNDAALVDLPGTSMCEIRYPSPLTGAVVAIEPA